MRQYFKGDICWNKLAETCSILRIWGTARFQGNMVSYPKVALAVSIGAPDLSCIPCFPKFKMLSNFFQEFCSRLSTHITYTYTNAYMLYITNLNHFKNLLFSWEFVSPTAFGSTTSVWANCSRQMASTIVNILIISWSVAAVTGWLWDDLCQQDLYII